MALDQDLYFISVAARMPGMHPQTLRKYERLGLVQPTRTIGSMRLYSREELERLKLIKRRALTARDTRRRVVQELDELNRMLASRSNFSKAVR
jgi:MerR family transcriptional regulator/heat shock protein HspR